MVALVVLVVGVVLNLRYLPPYYVLPRFVRYFVDAALIGTVMYAFARVEEDKSKGIWQ